MKDVNVKEEGRIGVMAKRRGAWGITKECRAAAGRGVCLPIGLVSCESAGVEVSYGWKAGRSE